MRPGLGSQCRRAMSCQACKILSSSMCILQLRTFSAVVFCVVQLRLRLVVVVLVQVLVVVAVVVSVVVLVVVWYALRLAW
jgi:hypothetical protein